jgi:hypothetical protein
MASGGDVHGAAAAVEAQRMRTGAEGRGASSRPALIIGRSLLCRGQRHDVLSESRMREIRTQFDERDVETEPWPSF